ncbi:MAG: bifunctional 5,10-methylenetetrahydrofolate dehydrogenase/5,10-methenyltetrahydrofolate cyclohydrolase [Patescibacteria group bacterium]|nr:bifunctional 5,10-methylenetetrahydrofolate dehydrogenase/5,10-methenyltetrahydrofolate cyclohydrolase [Patescibacteria group bacterium]
MKIIDGKKLAEKIQDDVVEEIVKLNGGHAEQALKRPNLAIILVGDREDSKIYVAKKEREAKKVGIDTHLYQCSEKISKSELLEMVKCLNEDELIDAILVQLPLPAAIDTDTIIMSIDPVKDVDGFHPDNLEKLLTSCQFDGLMPPVFAAALEMLASINYHIKDKQVYIISNSDIFGKSLAHVLKCQGAKTAVVKPEDAELTGKISQADILITAVGKPEFIKKEMIKAGAVIIDIGITKLNDRVVGDVDFNDVKDKAGYLTPVPGGVGPMTIAMAFKNTVEIYKRRHKI